MPGERGVLFLIIPTICRDNFYQKKNLLNSFRLWALVPNGTSVQSLKIVAVGQKKIGVLSSTPTSLFCPLRKEKCLKKAGRRYIEPPTCG